MALSEYISQYGATIALVAFLSILITGIVKEVFKASFEKLGAAKSKTIYQIIVTGLVLLFTAIELATSQRLTSFQSLLEEFLIAYAAAQVMYPVYENYHIRDLLKMAISALFKDKE